MTKLAPTTSPLALAAILAASAIPSTMASAQEAAAPAAAPAPAPVIVLPPVDAAPAAPAPAPIILPDTTTPPAAQAAPEPASSPAARTSPRTAATSATRSSSRTTAPSPSAVAGPAASEPSTIAPPVTAPDAAIDPIAPPLAADPAPVAAAPAAPAEDNGWLIALALGGLAVGGGIAYAATAGNRRRKLQPADAPTYRETRNEGRAPVRKPLPTSSLAATVAGADARREANPEVVPAGTPTYAADVPAGATPVARTFSEPARIPLGPVPTGAERQALIDRMVAAAPDASNPFTSLKSRRKRARILLAAAEHRQRQDATEPFDFRNYASFSQQEAGRPGGQQSTRTKETVN